MRLIEKSVARNLFESLSSDRVIEAINAAFDGTDFVVSYIESKDDYNVVVGVTAYGQDGEEMSRDIDFEFPNTDFDSVYEVCDEWISSHNSPDLFYENVMINTGSTTITSDETGVVVEDNGNTITVGNGVTVDVDNEADVLPAEMDLVAPDAEVPVEEPTEDTLDDDIIEEPTEELEENATEDFHGTTELARQVFVSLQKDANGKYLVMNDGIVTEEIQAADDNEAIKLFNQKYQKLEDDNLNESSFTHINDVWNALEKCNTVEDMEKVINEVPRKFGSFDIEVIKDGTVARITNTYEEHDDVQSDVVDFDLLTEAEQSVDIFKNPEFDYKITDITVLQPTDSGDVRAIDMNDILVGLDEALTERYGNANTVTLNSYLTKHGKDYSSAIVDVSAPNFKGYVYTFESSFDGKLYDCVIKETATNKRLEHLCVKSADPVKPFVNAIVEAINVSYKLSEHSSISEDVELLVNKDKVEDNNGVTYTDDVRVEEHNDHVEDNMKDKEKKLKPKKKFEVGEEPDQKNTQGEEVAKINLKETEENLVDKLTALKAKLNDNSTDLDTIASELDIACDEAGYDRLWEEGLILMELVKEHIQKAMAEDFDNGKSMLKHLDDTDAQYAYVDGYANYRNLDKDVLENMIDDIISDLSINESVEGNNEFMSSDIKAGDVVQTNGAGDVEVLDVNKDKNYILVKRGNDYQPFVAAWNPELVDGKLTWGQGHYFDNEEDAREYFNNKLNEAEELVDETPLAEDINPKAVFHRKPSSVADMRAAEANGLVTNKSSYVVINKKELSRDEFLEFSDNLLRDYDWLEELYVTDGVDTSVFKCIEVVNADDGESIMVDPSGYKYARYAALTEPLDVSKEITDEPIDEVIE